MLVLPISLPVSINSEPEKSSILINAWTNGFENLSYTSLDISEEALNMTNNEIKKIKVGESVYIPLKVKHRLENEHDEIDLMIVEVQTGSYLGEDDIIRYEDIYSRK